MPPFRAPPLIRLAAIGVLVATLGLAGCGRKGPLDPPPGASLDGVTQPDMAEMSANSRPTAIGGETPDGYSGVGPDGQPAAPKGPQKRIFLDGLLN